MSPATGRRTWCSSAAAVPRCSCCRTAAPARCSPRALPSKAADPLIRALRRLLAALPPSLRRSVCFDNGSEFVRHYELHALGVDTFCCDPHAPWQKGGVENAIGRLRGPLPRSTDLAARSRRALNRTLARFNNTPRKCLDFQTQPNCSRPNCPACRLNPHSRSGAGMTERGGRE